MIQQSAVGFGKIEFFQKGRYGVQSFPANIATRKGVGQEGRQFLLRGILGGGGGKGGAKQAMKMGKQIMKMGNNAKMATGIVKQFLK